MKINWNLCLPLLLLAVCMALALAPLGAVAARADGTAKIVLTVPDGGFVYTGEAIQPDLTVIDGQGDVVPSSGYHVGYTNNILPGTATVAVEGKGAYTFSIRTTFPIAKATLTATVKSREITYGVNPKDGTGLDNLILDGFVNDSDRMYAAIDATNLRFTYSYETDGATVEFPAMGTYIIRAAGLEADNYDFKYVDGTLTVAQVKIKNLGIEFVDGMDNIVYDGSEKKPAVAVYGDGKELVASEYTVNYRDNVNAGTATVTVHNNGQNYAFEDRETTFQIQPAIVTVTAKDIVLTYGEDPGEKVQYSGFLNGDTVTAAGVVTGSLDFGGYTLEDGSVGTYQITEGDLQSRNYDFIFDLGLLTVQPKTIVPAVALAPADGFVYDGTAKEPQVTLTDENGNTIPETQYDVAYTNHLGSGTATVTVKAGKNYVFSDKTVDFTIAKATLTATISREPIEYGNDPKKSEKGVDDLIFEGFANDADRQIVFDATNLRFTYSYETDGTAVEFPAVGTYTISAAGLEADNYDFAYVDGTLTVTQAQIKNLGIDFVDGVDNIVYDGSEKKPAMAVYGDGKELVASEYTVTYRDNVNVGTATATVHNNGQNYAFEDREITFQIRPAIVKVTAKDIVITYGEDPEEKVQYSGFLNGDTAASVLLDTLDFGYDGNENGAGTYTIKEGRLSSYNYDFECDLGTLTVKPKEIRNPDVTILLSDHYVYNGKQQLVDDVIVKDDDGNELPWGQFDLLYENNTDAGTATVTVKAGSNYRFNDRKMDFTIAKAPLTVTAADIHLTVAYGDDPEELKFPRNRVKVVGLLEDDREDGDEYQSVDEAKALEGELVFTSNYTKGQDVGTYALIPSGLTAKNYEITFVPGTLTVQKKTIAAPDIILALPAGGYPHPEQGATPGVTVKDAAGNVIPGTEYRVTYLNHTSPGMATVMVQSVASGNYAFSGAAWFEIRPSGTTSGVDQPTVSVSASPGGKTVALHCARDGAEIYYSLDGTEPTISGGTPYREPILLEASTNLRAIAALGDLCSTAVVSQILVEAAEAPTSTPGSGAELEANAILTLSTGTAGATIFYTTDGTAPTSDSKVYRGGILLDSSTVKNGVATIRAIAVGDGYRSSEEFTGTYSIQRDGAKRISVSLGQVTAHAGDSVALPIHVVTTGSGIGAMYLVVDYDPEQLEPTVSFQAAEEAEGKITCAASRDSITLRCDEDIPAGMVGELILTPLATLPPTAICDVTLDAGSSHVRLTGEHFTNQNIFVSQQGAVLLEAPRTGQFVAQADWDGISSAAELRGKASATVHVGAQFTGSAPPEEYRSGKVVLALYDRLGMLVGIQMKEFVLDSGLSFLSTLKVACPKGMEPGRMKVMVLSQNMAPLMEALELR